MLAIPHRNHLHSIIKTNLRVQDSSIRCMWTNACSATQKCAQNTHACLAACRSRRAHCRALRLGTAADQPALQQAAPHGTRGSPHPAGPVVPDKLPVTLVALNSTDLTATAGSAQAGDSAQSASPFTRGSLPGAPPWAPAELCRRLHSELAVTSLGRGGGGGRMGGVRRWKREQEETRRVQLVRGEGSDVSDSTGGGGGGGAVGDRRPGLRGAAGLACCKSAFPLLRRQATACYLAKRGGHLARPTVLAGELTGDRSALSRLLPWRGCGSVRYPPTRTALQSTWAGTGSPDRANCYARTHSEGRSLYRDVAGGVPVIRGDALSDDVALVAQLHQLALQPLLRLGPNAGFHLLDPFKLFEVPHY